MSPFRIVDRLVEEAQQLAETIVVDLHAEATSEKVAMGHYLDGRVTAVLGTHTHVQTSDARVLPGGTAYMTDVGMTGPRDSVIGVRTDIILRRFTTELPQAFEVAEGPVRLDAALIAAEGGRDATSYRRRQRGPVEPAHCLMSRRGLALAAGKAASPRSASPHTRHSVTANVASSSVLRATTIASGSGCMSSRFQ